MKNALFSLLALLLSGSAFADAHFAEGDLITFKVVKTIQLPMNDDLPNLSSGVGTGYFSYFKTKTAERYDREIPAGTLLILSFSRNSYDESTLGMSVIELKCTDSSSSIDALTIGGPILQNNTEDGLIKHISELTEGKLTIVKIDPNHIASVDVH